MKKHSIYIATAILVLIGACKQEPIVPASPSTPTAAEPDPGNVTWTKFVAIGNSFFAGTQAGALFTDGQNNSIPAIMAKQFIEVGGPATFVQPDINASLGWNLFVTQPFLSNPANPVLGRMLLQYSGATSPRPRPQAYAPGNLEAVPNPLANPGFMYAGNKALLTNFSVSAITLGQALTPATGGPSTANPAFTPFYLRFASSPSPDGVNGSSMMSDAKAANGTIIALWLGFDDFLLYAAFGADPTKAPLTSGATFTAQYNAALFAPSTHTGILTVNPNSKIVIGNFPDIFKMPHFTAVAWNALPLDQATADQLTAALATGYNTWLDTILTGALGPTTMTADEVALRKLTYKAGQNAILINDETATDLTAYAVGPFAGLAPYAKARQTNKNDVIPFSTGTILGTSDGGSGVYGVSTPLGDQYALIPTEITAIKNARTSFNATIAAVQASNSLRIALADVAKEFDDLVAAKAKAYGSISVNAKIDPPAGIFSEDGLHVNSRGAAYMANIFIDAINYQFRSTVPRADLSLYSATALPIP